MLTLTTNWLKAMVKSGATPVFLVELDLSTNATTIIHKFVSSVNTTMSYPASVSGIAPMATKLDPVKRTASMGECSVVFVDDGVLREIISSTRFKGKKIAISLGEESLEEADYAPYFVGTIEDVTPSAGEIELSLVNTFGFLKQKVIKNQTYTMLHPLEVMEKIFEKAELSSDLWDATSFDPDTYSANISHWNVTRGGYNQVGASSTIKAENAFALISELAHLCQGTVVPSEDGKLSFSLYDPTTPSLETWGADDIAGFAQNTSVSKFYNKIVFRFQYVKDGDTYVRVITHTNTDSSEAAAWPGDSDKELVLDFDTKWLNAQTMLWEDLAAADTEVTVSGLLANGFCGMRQQGSFSEPDANRKVYLLVMSEIEGTGQPTKAECIECDGITLDQDVWVNPADMNIWQSENFFVGAAIAMKSSYDITTNGRKYFDPVPGSTGVDFTADVLNRTFVYDATIPVYICRKVIERLSEGLSVISVSTDLSKFAMQIGDLVTIEEPQFLAFGADGATTDKWEIIQKNVDVRSGKIKWQLARVAATTGYTETWSPTTTGELVSDFANTAADLLKAWNRTGLILGDFGPDYSISTLAGLDLTVNTMATSSPYTPIQYPSNGTTTTMPISSTITVGRDVFTGMTIFGTNQSNLGSSSYPIETVTTDGTGITNIESLTPLTGLQGSIVNGFPGFQGTNLQFPYWDNGTGGLFLNTTDNIPLLGQTSPDSYDTRVIAQGPTAFYKMDESASSFPTVVDSSGNGNNGTTTGNPPTAEEAGLIRSSGLAVGHSFAFNQIGTGVGEEQAFFINGLDCSTSIGVSFSAWVYGAAGPSAEQTIFCIASDGSGNDIFRITHDPGDNELRVFLNAISTSFTDSSLGKNLSDGSTHHLVVTWNAVSKELDIWIDGALRGYDTVDTTLSTTGTRMGWGVYLDDAGTFDADNSWNGIMDVAGYWDDKVLSTAEIMDQYQAGGYAFGGAGVDYQPLITSPTNAALSGITADDISETADRKFQSTGEAAEGSPLCAVFCGGSAAIPDTGAQYYDVPLDQAIVDTGAQYDLTDNFWTVPESGAYNIEATLNINRPGGFGTARLLLQFCEVGAGPGYATGDEIFRGSDESIYDSGIYMDGRVTVTASLTAGSRYRFRLYISSTDDTSRAVTGSVAAPYRTYASFQKVAQTSVIPSVDPGGLTESHLMVGNDIANAEDCLIAGDVSVDWASTGNANITINDSVIGGELSASNFDAEQLNRAWMYRSANYTATGVGFHKILFNAANYDTGVDFNWATSEWTCPQDGVYQISVLVYLQNFSVGSCYLYLYKDGASIALGNCSNVMGNNQILNELNFVGVFETGDVLSIYVNSGLDASYTVTGGTNYTRWQVARVK